MNREDCIFCKIACGEIPSKTIFEDEMHKVILDIGPATRGHALIIPKDHADDLYDLPEESVGQAFRLAKKMAVLMKAKLKCDGFNLVQNNGETAGQTVKHFHVHLIPRYENDNQRISWENGQSVPEELEEIRKQIVE